MCILENAKHFKGKFEIVLGMDKLVSSQYSVSILCRIIWFILLNVHTHVFVIMCHVHRLALLLAPHCLKGGQNLFHSKIAVDEFHQWLFQLTCSMGVFQWETLFENVQKKEICS